MCGIVGYTGHRQALGVVVEGLSRLAAAKGHDVDQPRNLAKSVTVE